MISVQLDCEHRGCRSNEYVDVYTHDLDEGTALSRYVPEGWAIMHGSDGLARALCPSHASRLSPT